MKRIEPVEVAVEAAKAAGEVLMELRGRVDVQMKGRIDLVTEADVAAEKVIVERLRNAFPDHQIVAEESGVHEAVDADYCWYVDPLDGTTNYAHGLPEFAVSIALLEKGVPMVGVVHAPGLRECYVAEKGKGTTLNGKPVRVSSEGELVRSLLATGFPYDIATSEHNNIDHFCRFVLACRDVRRIGAAALDLAYLSAGRFDAFWEYGLNPWDFAAGCLLVEEAGGQVSDFRGGPFDVRMRSVLASNGVLHETMLKGLAEGKTGFVDE